MNSATYVVGREALLIDLWPRSLRLRPIYESNWRILHIDSFEPGYGNRIVHFEFKMQPIYAR